MIQKNQYLGLVVDSKDKIKKESIEKICKTNPTKIRKFYEENFGFRKWEKALKLIMKKMSNKYENR